MLALSLCPLPRFKCTCPQSQLELLTQEPGRPGSLLKHLPSYEAQPGLVIHAPCQSSAPQPADPLAPAPTTPFGSSPLPAHAPLCCLLQDVLPPGGHGHAMLRACVRAADRLREMRQRAPAGGHSLCLEVKTLLLHLYLLICEMGIMGKAGTCQISLW